MFNIQCVTTVKPETLASGNFDEFGELGSNYQTLTFQSKATSKISAFASISPKFLSPKFLESGFTKVQQHQSFRFYGIITWRYIAICQW